jgi:hypothetical protein
MTEKQHRDPVATAARKARERQSKRAAGMVRIDVWAHADDAIRVRRYVERLNKRRWPQGVE